MVQSTDNTLSNQSGASFRTELNSILGAHLSSHKGSTEPSYITTGGFWIDDTSTPWIYKIYDGAASFGFLEINPSTNNVTLINVKDGDARTEGANIGQIQDGDFQVLGSVAGTNTITASLTPAITAYAAGQRFTFIPASANTGASTININSVGAKALQINGQALVGGELGTSDTVDIVYDGTQFQITSPTSKQPVKGLRFPDQGELTIATGAVTITGTHHTIDTESDAASDDLDTINGGVDGMIIIVRAENTARTVVLKDGTGNIETPDGSDITLDNTEKEVMLKYDGATSDWHVIAQPPASAGGWVPLQTQTVSVAVASVDFTSNIDSTYKKYAVVFDSVRLATDGATLRIRTGNGGAFDSGASDYSYVYTGRFSGGAATDEQAAIAQIQLGIGTGNATNEGASGIVYISDPSNTSTYTQFFYELTLLDQSSNVAVIVGGGQREEAAAHDRVQFVTSGGNIAAGTFTLYGLAGA